MATLRGWWFKLVTVVGGAAFLGLGVLPYLDNLLPRPTPKVSSPPAEQVSAAKGYELVLQKDPNNTYALRGLLEIRLQEKDLKGAVPLLERLAKLHPQVSEYAILLAQTQAELGDKEAAIKTYRALLQRQPGNLLALVGVTDLLVQLERPAMAESLLQQSLQKVNPRQADVTGIQMQMGRVYLAQGKTAAALALFDQLMRQNPRDFRPVLAKAQTLQALGKTQQAQPLFTKAVELAPPQHRDEIQRLAAAAPSQPKR